MEERKEWGHSEFKLEKESGRCSGIWYLLAFCSLGLMCVVMWWMEHTVFGDAVTCFHGGLVGAMLGLLIGTLIRKDKKPQEFSKGEKCAGWVLLAVFTVFCFWIISTMQNLWVMGVQFAAMALWAVIGTIYEKKKKLQKQQKHHIIDLIITNLVIGLATLALPVILDVSTVKQAEELLTEAGYEDITFDYSPFGRWIDGIREAYPEKEDIRMYLFQGEMGKEIVFDPWTGEIVRE